ncbi:hypothetical protein NQZ68_030758 [Dissostichus eleginoides]|nr:hypothetical protein NQZ68_030758 [Dissostichus eleginoides]
MVLWLLSVATPWHSMNSQGSKREWALLTWNLRVDRPQKMDHCGTFSWRDSSIHHGRQHFVDKHRTELINRVNGVASILDKLLEEKVITQPIYDEILSTRPSQEQMRKLFNGPLKAAGLGGKEVFYRILEEELPFLIDGLKGKK